MQRRALASVTLAVLVACGSGGSTTGPSSQVVASILITPGRDTLLAIGRTRQLTAQARNAAGNVINGKTFAWQSSAMAVASVDPGTGLVTAVAQGEATISASVDGKTGQASILVAQQVSTVEVTPGTPTLTAIGANQQFTAVAKDAAGAVVNGVGFLWISSDPSVATVDATGKATAKAPGTTTVTAAALGVPGSTLLTVTQVATQLAFTVQPTGATEGLNFPNSVQVEIRDANGALVVGARNTVNLAIGTNPGAGVLGGTISVNAVGGVANFAGLTLSQAGFGYTLVASATGLTSATSSAFTTFLNFVSVGVGNATTCGVTASNALYCWGQNNNGQLGDGTTTNRSVPTRVVAPAGVRFIAVSQNQRDAVTTVTNCALAVGGSAYCWGYGAGGAIGDGGSVNRLTATLVTPPLGVTFTSISAGGTFTCGLESTGTGYCWGNGVVGTLGDGLHTNHALPTAVTPPAGVFFSTLFAGFQTACATTATGVAYCWGINLNNEIGDGTTTQRNVPSPVSAPAGVSFASVQTGVAGCGMTFTQVMYCWGAGGLTGDGTSTPRPTPVLVSMPAGVTFVTFATGVDHTCALTTAGAAWCWGYNGTGALGDGTATDRPAPVAVSMPAGVSFVAISVGSEHSCGLTALGAIWCWGLGAYGQLGDGTNAARFTPVRVAR